MKRFLLIIIILSSLTLPFCVEGVIRITPPGPQSIDELITRVTDYLFTIALVLAPAMIVIAAFLFVISGGDPQKIQQAKNMIFWTIIGFTIIMLSKGLISVIKSFLGVK